jgi:hypothetical protein
MCSEILSSAVKKKLCECAEAGTSSMKRNINTAKAG